MSQPAIIETSTSPEQPSKAAKRYTPETVDTANRTEVDDVTIDQAQNASPEQSCVPGEDDATAKDTVDDLSIDRVKAESDHWESLHSILQSRLLSKRARTSPRYFNSFRSILFDDDRSKAKAELPSEFSSMQDGSTLHSGLQIKRYIDKEKRVAPSSSKEDNQKAADLSNLYNTYYSYKRGCENVQQMLNGLPDTTDHCLSDKTRW
ncbi:uncharacterized protein IL334_006761 [Kwoniella shivajii]|uniref:Uncharacterized protein n=1 Tax=Kwoniella shivajii TaxID=564305 RepID=A0ABZ1D8U0_9TREE|nr:hypothetical protein IL334_006761 [Kwoniella shivajii]